MDRYTVLLADDEEEVLQVIGRKINWEGLGFSVIGYANNGVKALEMVEEFQPDVVMTDIKMPYMDGMELTKRIRAEFPATKILIFTGFDEFEYAKEAIHLEVEEYVLKPVNSVELTNVFTQLKIKLDQEISEKRNVEILKKYYMESLPFLRANFYSTLIEGKIREEEVEKYLSDYRIVFESPYYCCLVVHTSATQTVEGMDPVLLSMSVQKQAKEKLGDRWKAKSFSYLGNVVMIAQIDSESAVSELTDECDRFCKYARRIIGAVVTVGVGRICSDILELSQSYSSAREAVSYRALYGTGRAINIKEIAPQEADTPASSGSSELSGLFKMIRLGSREEVMEAAKRCMEQVFAPGESLQHHHVAIMELLSALYRFAVGNDIEQGLFTGDIGGLYAGLIGRGPDMLHRWFVDSCLFLRENLASTRNLSTRSFVQRAQEYVRDHYPDESLSLDSVCAELGVSNSYFSTIFKRETGKTFISYLTDFRMDHAARRLLETGEKSYVIAKEVGYTDPNYFSYVFKRRFGVSPSKYRTEQIKSEGSLSENIQET